MSMGSTSDYRESPLPTWWSDFLCAQACRISKRGQVWPCRLHRTPPVHSNGHQDASRRAGAPVTGKKPALGDSLGTARSLRRAVFLWRYGPPTSPRRWTRGQVTYVSVECVKSIGPGWRERTARHRRHRSRVAKTATEDREPTKIHNVRGYGPAGRRRIRSFLLSRRTECERVRIVETRRADT
jgi:hypothetical protein